MLQTIDFISASGEAAYADTKSKIEYNLSKFPPYKEAIEKRRASKLPSLVALVARKWIILFLDEPDIDSGVMYFFDHRAKLENEEDLQDEALEIVRGIQVRYLKDFKPEMDTVTLTKDLPN